MNAGADGSKQKVRKIKKLKNYTSQPHLQISSPNSRWIYWPFSSVRVSSCSLKWTISMRRRSSQCAPCRLQWNHQYGDTFQQKSRHLLIISQQLIREMFGAQPQSCHGNRHVNRHVTTRRSRTATVPVVLRTMTWRLLPLPPPPLPSVLTARSTSSSEIRTTVSAPTEGMIA